MIIGIIILSVLITFLIWLFIIFLLKQGAKQAKIQKEKRNKVKGKFGEQLVSMCINKFKDEDDLTIVIEMLNAITRWAIIRTVTSNNLESMRKKYIKQLEYIKYGIIKK